MFGHESAWEYENYWGGVSGSCFHYDIFEVRVCGVGHVWKQILAFQEEEKEF
jgi:hypothetical protein